MKFKTEFLESFNEHGYVVVRGLLDKEKISTLSNLVVNYLFRNRMADGVTEHGQPKYKKHRPNIQALYFEEIMKSELIEEIFQDDKVLSFVRRLLYKRDIFVYPTKLIRAIPPKQYAYFKPAGVHQDYPEVQGGDSQITLWAPLFPVDEKTGSLPVYSKSREHGVLPLQLADNPSGWEIRKDYLLGRAVFELSPGDALLFNTYTPHGGSENIGGGWRVSIEGRFQPLSETLAEGNLKKPISFDTWQEQYEGWQCYGHYWSERHPELISFDDSWERWRDLEGISEGGRLNPRAKVALNIAVKFARSKVTRLAALKLLEKFEE